MKELNISQVIIRNRRLRGVTQEELASYMGVSKASVSKWETGQSYPDITFLPQLASYFNISIDELIGYEPQMEPQDIKKLYQEFTRRFSEEPFEEVYEECRETIKKYFSCFPLLLKMAYLYLNHHMLAEPQKQQDILDEAKGLFARIKSECGEPGLAREAEYGEAITLLMANRPTEVLELLGEEIGPLMSNADLIGQAYLILGNVEASAKISQVMAFQHLMSLIGQIPKLLVTETGNPERIDMILQRAMEMEKIFKIDHLHPNSMAQIYITAVQVYMGMGREEKVFQYLERYVNLAEEFFPLSLHGDDFFDKVEGWIKEEGSPVPRDERLVKTSLYQGLANNPVLEPLKENPEFKNILRRLAQKLKMEV